MPDTQQPVAIGTAPPLEAVEEDLVVTLEHQRLVEAELARLQVRYAEAFSSPQDELGLALLTGLKGVATRAAQVRAYHSAEIARLESQGQRLFTDLDALLFGLRRDFAERYGGWVPELGKNRHVASVAPAGPGAGKVMFAGFGDATTASVATAELGAYLVPPYGVVTVKGSGDEILSLTVAGPGRGEPMTVTVGMSQSGGTLVASGLSAAGTESNWAISGLGPGQGQPMQGRDPAYLAPGVVPESSGTAGAGVRVGMVDTALYQPESGSDALQPFKGHATFVRSLIAQSAPAAEVDLQPVLDRKTGKATAWDTAMAMVGYAHRDNAVDVLNLSLGCRTADGQPPLVLARAVDRLRDKVVVVAAAGNHGDTDYPSAPMWPAALPNVVAVGAYWSADDSLAEFSPRLPWVTLVAPGVNVHGEFVDATVELSDGTQVPFDGWAVWSGTSFAAATVSGVIAAGTRPGETTARAMLDELLTSGDPNDVVRKYTGPS